MHVLYKQECELFYAIVCERESLGELLYLPGFQTLSWH
jgi:hypothetical protein